MDLAGMTALTSAEVELLAGNPAAAAELGSEGCRQLRDLGERSVLSTGAGYLAQALYALDRLDEADVWAGQAAELGSSDDMITQMLWRQARAKVLARRGEPENAERLVREAIAIGEQSDMLDAHGDAYADLGEVLALAGRGNEAASAFQRARERHERKGNLVSARRAKTRLTRTPREAAPIEAQLAAKAEGCDREEVGDPCDCAEPAVGRAAVATSDLDDERDDDRADHGQPGDRGGADVDLAEALVASVAAQAANRLAPPAEQEQRAEAGHDRERNESAAGSPPIHCATEHDHAERRPRTAAETTSI